MIPFADELFGQCLVARTHSFPAVFVDSFACGFSVFLISVSQFHAVVFEQEHLGVETIDGENFIFVVGLPGGFAQVGLPVVVGVADYCASIFIECIEISYSIVVGYFDPTSVLVFEAVCYNPFAHHIIGNGREFAGFALIEARPS